MQKILMRTRTAVAAAALILSAGAASAVQVSGCEQLIMDLIGTTQTVQLTGKKADKAGIHRTHVSLLERGKRMPSLQVIKKLAAALDTTMASLMEELEGEEKPRKNAKG